MLMCCSGSYACLKKKKKDLKTYLENALILLLLSKRKKIQSCGSSPQKGHVNKL